MKKIPNFIEIKKINRDRDTILTRKKEKKKERKKKSKRNPKERR